MAKSLEVGHDKLGREIRIGSIIVAPYSASMTKIGRVVKITPKNVSCESVNETPNKYKSSWLKAQAEVICLDDLEQVVMYMMTRNL